MITLKEGTKTYDFGYGTAYGVTAIFGSIDGVAINGELGVAAKIQRSAVIAGGYITYDNAIFAARSGSRFKYRRH